jgi:hypothetical protein
MTVATATETVRNTVQSNNNLKSLYMQLLEQFLDNLINMHGARNIMTEIRAYGHILEIYLHCPFEIRPNTCT